MVNHNINHNIQINIDRKTSVSPIDSANTKTTNSDNQKRILKTRNHTLSFNKLLDFNNIKDKIKILTTNLNLSTKHKKESSVTEEMLCKFSKNKKLYNNGKLVTDSASMISEESIFSKKCNFLLIFSEETAFA
jgi:hypothetical protein